MPSDILDTFNFPLSQLLAVLTVIETVVFNVNKYKVTVKSRYLKVKIHLKLLTSQSKFSGPRKFTLR